METFKLGKICHNIGIWALKLFFVLKFRVPIIKYCVKSYKLCCFTSISLCSRPLDPLIMMKRHRTVIFLHIKIKGWNWNIISNDQFSLSTWVQRVMIISDDTPWSYLYIHRVEIGLRLGLGLTITLTQTLTLGLGLKFENWNQISQSGQNLSYSQRFSLLSDEYSVYAHLFVDWHTELP